MSFLYTYKAALYPLSLDSSSAVGGGRGSASIAPDGDSGNAIPAQPRSLVEVCCQKIVQDSAMTRAARRTVPVDLCYTLMSEALRLDRDLAVEQLVANWPWHTLALRNFVPVMFGSIAPLVGETELAEHMRRGVKRTTCLAHTFMECLKKKTATKLRCLDLTGYPAGWCPILFLFPSPFSVL